MEPFVEFPLVDIPTVEDSRGNLSFIQKGAIPFEPSIVSVCERPQKECFIVPLSGEICILASGKEFSLVSPRRGMLLSGSTVDFSSSNGAIWLSLAPISKNHTPDPYRVLNAPFPIRRIYYLTSVPEGAERGGHSHLRQSVMIKVLRGGFRLNLDDGRCRTSHMLYHSGPDMVIPPDVWRSMDRFMPDTIVLILSSTPYDPSDYIYDYELFKRLSLRTIKPIESPVRYPFVNLPKADCPYEDSIRKAIERVSRSGVYVGGVEVASFENELASFVGTRHAVGVASGLDALRLSLRALVAIGRLHPGDEVIVPANTYIASILAITDASLTPVLAEPNPLTYNLSAQTIRDALTPKTRAIMPVHLYGRVCWSTEMSDLIERLGLVVIEDCAQAIGAQIGSKRAGSLGNVAAFSFYPTKNIGCRGDGGAVTTDDPELARTIRALANYGSDRRYHNILLGFNSRLDPIQAAILREKLPFADIENRKRRAKAQIYCSAIRRPDIILPQMPTNPVESVWHQFVVRIPDGKRHMIMSLLKEKGIETDVHYPVPPHRQPCYSGRFTSSYPLTDLLAQEVLSLPIANHLTEAQIQRISSVLNSLPI